jgi:hypothetical protein
MVREMEGPLSQPVTVQVDLPVDPDVAERIVEQAFGTIGDLLTAGRQVILATFQPDGEHITPLSGLIEAGRQLARAVPPGLQDRLPGRR